MDILKFAQETELDGAKYYRRPAAKMPTRGRKIILNLIADEELRHYHTLRELDANTRVLDLRRWARDLESRLRDIYVKTADRVNFTSQKNLLMRLADEELRHCQLLDEMMGFLSKPETWLENAEFHHQDEY